MSVERIDCSLIERDYVRERLLHIEELCFYIYEDSVYLNIIGEIYGNEIDDDFCFRCMLYDQEDDLILSEKNRTYGSGLVSSVIKAEAFFNGFPFSFRLSKPKTSISCIRIVPERC